MATIKYRIITRPIHGEPNIIPVAVERETKYNVWVQDAPGQPLRRISKTEWNAETLNTWQEAKDRLLTIVNQEIQSRETVLEELRQFAADVAELEPEAIELP